MKPTRVDRLLELAKAYAVSRVYEKRLRRATRVRCEISDRFAEEQRCRLSGRHEVSWCQPCREQKEAFSAFQIQRAQNKAALRAIERLAYRLTLPEATEHEEPKPLLDMMTGSVLERQGADGAFQSVAEIQPFDLERIREVTNDGRTKTADAGAGESDQAGPAAAGAAAAQTGDGSSDAGVHAGARPADPGSIEGERS